MNKPPAQRMRKRGLIMSNKIKFTWQDYENRVIQLEEELGISTSDAQAILDIELKEKGVEPSEP